MPRRCTISKTARADWLLVFAGSVGAHGYGIDARREALARVLDGVYLDAGIAIESRSRPERAATRRLRSPRWSRAAALRPGAIDYPVRPRPDRRGGFAAASPVPWPSSRRASRARLPISRRRLSRTVRGRRRAHHPQCRRLGGAGARLCARSRGRLSARARSRRHRARRRAAHDLFPAGRRRRPVPDDREIPRAAQAVGARRRGLRARAGAGFRRGRDRVADDDAARSLREHAARDDRGRSPRDSAAPMPSRCCRSRRRSACPIVSRGGSRATPSSSCWRSPISRRVADPAAGSGGIEDLTDAALPRGLDAVQEIEKAGGALARARAGLIQGKVADVRAERRERRSRRPQGSAHRHERFPDLRRAAGQVLE